MLKQVTCVKLTHTDYFNKDSLYKNRKAQKS